MFCMHQYLVQIMIKIMVLRKNIHIMMVFVLLAHTSLSVGLYCDVSFPCLTVACLLCMTFTKNAAIKNI